MPKNIKILDRHSVPAGTVIIEQGAFGGRAFSIESGKVEVFTKNAAGEHIFIAELGPGALIGEIALVDDGRRTASVRALEITTLVTVSGHDFHRAMQKSKRLQSRVTQTMAHRLQEIMHLLLKWSTDRPQDPRVAEEVPMLMNKLKDTLRRITGR